MKTMLVRINSLANYLKSQSNQRLGVGDEHEKDQNQDHEHADEKAINEGRFSHVLPITVTSNHIHWRQSTKHGRRMRPSSMT